MFDSVRSLRTSVEPLPVMRSADDSRKVEPRHFLAPVGVGLFALGLMLLVSNAKELPIRDPDARYVGSPLALIGLIIAVFLVLDLVPRTFRAVRAEGVGPQVALRRIFLERWWGRRGVIVLACLLGFYATYLSYRNLKSFMPFLTDADYDSALLHLDRAMFFGHQPATLLHDLLGTDIAAYALSAVYLAFLSFVPISLGVALIWSSRVVAGVWYVTALTLNWMLGALSYFLVPSLGPAFVRPGLFGDLPSTGVSDLRDTLLEHRAEVLANPSATDAVQSIAAFASLHIAVVFTAALIAQLARAPKALRVALWCYLGLTALATVYFGWHYVIDDVAGIAIGGIATYCAALLVGLLPPPRGRLERLTQRASGTG